MPGQNNSDKFLWAIVAGIIILVILAFVVIARRPSPEFLPEESPASAVHNYLLALQLGDYERAYGYLSPDLAYPADVNEFFDSLNRRPWEFSGTDNFSLVVETSEPVSSNSVAVTVRQIYNNNALFGSGDYSETFKMRVEDTPAGWKLVSGERFWSTCWGDRDTCTEVPRSEP
jgi:hypothetical protein